MRYLQNSSSMGGKNYLEVYNLILPSWNDHTKTVKDEDNMSNSQERGPRNLFKSSRDFPHP